MGSQLFRDVLCKAKLIGNLVEIYLDPETMDRSTVGFVMAVDDSDFTLRAITPEGEEDGATSRSVEDIVKIAEDTRYLRRLGLLIEQRGKVFEAAFTDRYSEDGEGAIFSELIRAKKANQVVTIFLKDDPEAEAAMGFIEKSTGDFVQLREITCQGESNGITTIRIEDIGRINRNERDARRYALYYRHSKRLSSDTDYEGSPR